MYLLTGDRTRAVVADFDSEDASPPREFVATATHYGIPAYIERSKSKGYHVWTFFRQQGVLAAKARLVVRHILAEIGGSNREVFPKQDVLPPGSGTYGNFINAPLLGRLVPRGRTVFVKAGEPMEPYLNQWEFLDGIERVSEETLDEIIEVNELVVGKEAAHTRSQSLGVFQLPETLPPCAVRMLEEGVTAYQRVSCFRLAVHLRKVGLPLDIALAPLSEWAKKNHPEEGKGVITPLEIRGQTTSAYLREYNGCGCEDPAVAPYCDPACPISSGNATQPKESSTVPQSERSRMPQKTECPHA